MGVFDPFIPQAWPYRYEGRIAILNDIHGGIPSDLATIKNWIKTRIAGGNEQVIQEEISKTVLEVYKERNNIKEGVVSVPTQADVDKYMSEAVEKVAKNVGASGFKRGTEKDGVHAGQLAYEGRCLKAALKEGVSIAYAAGKILNKDKADKNNPRGKNSWGRTNKQILSYSAEHIQVCEEKLWLESADDNGKMVPCMTPTGINTHPVHLYNGNALSQEEYVEGAEFDFTIVTDTQFSEEFWAMVWLTAQLQGLGSSRSMGRGRYEVIKWEAVEPIEQLATR